MKRTVLTVMVAGTLIAGGMGGCRGGLPSQDPEEYVGGVVSGIRTQAEEELRNTFSDEIGEFFKSDDLSKTLGMDGGEQAELEESVRAFIDQYSSDKEKLNEAKESLDTLLQSAESFSPEELQDRIEGIFAE